MRLAQVKLWLFADPVRTGVKEIKRKRTYEQLVHSGGIYLA